MRVHLIVVRRKVDPRSIYKIYLYKNSLPDTYMFMLLCYPFKIREFCIVQKAKLECLLKVFKFIFGLSSVTN